jgi:hypothetical protein
MKHDGIATSELLKYYAQYEAESRHVALKLLTKCNEMLKSYVVPELEDDPQLLNEMWTDPQTSVVKLLRTEAPVTGSNISVRLPTEAATNELRLLGNDIGVDRASAKRPDSKAS